ncbi:major histocompatibility complex class I-related gene protein-like isoform X2 [Labrus mixtus]|uniref:major histocompatibility complex class I-related gene protein-like isoform X2 n=1 Tax=Labrus mixtus TaxID=508554 RepID=UPI0029C03A04|nr:major histocompatibility complex class I-related gene protein-like isoform X2 [Labrus mixtus]
MKTLVFVSLVGLFLHDTTAEMHSLRYFYTASSEVPNFPEFVSVGMVDDFQVEYYDSNTKRFVPKQDWMNKVTEDRADYWEWQTEILKGSQQTFKVRLDNLKRRFNQTGGVHIVQRMYGCEWDDDTGDVNGHEQHGYDGEDFIVLDLKTLTWVAPQQQAVVTKQKWDNDKVLLEYNKNYFTNVCVDWLKKFVNYGRSSLMRTDLPTVSLLQKTPSSRVTCHATGFYPNRAMMFWRKDGEELHEDVDKGEILPNHDGSFQISADLQLPSDDWGKYDCVFQLSGVKEDIVTKLDKREIKTKVNPIYMIIVIIAVVLLLVTIVCAAGFCLYKKRNAKRPPSPVNDSAVQQMMLPNPNT